MFRHELSVKYQHISQLSQSCTLILCIHKFQQNAEHAIASDAICNRQLAMIGIDDDEFLAQEESLNCEKAKDAICVFGNSSHLCARSCILNSAHHTLCFLMCLPKSDR